MVTGISFRPQVTMAPPVVKQAEANNCREKLNEVETDVKNNQITDISAMTQRMQLESKLQDTKVAPVKYVEETKPQTIEPAKVSDVGAMSSPKDITDVIKKFHKGVQPSKFERSQVLMDQMNLYAASNMVLHGLF